MNGENFYNLVVQIQDRITNTLISKGNEYSNEENKLHNFDKAAKMSNQTREEALMGFLLKHQVSIDDIVNNLENKLPSVEILEEKITDILNYYILLEACIKDRMNKNYIKNMEEELYLQFSKLPSFLYKYKARNFNSEKDKVNEG